MERDSVKVFLRMKPNDNEDSEKNTLKSIDKAKSTDRMIVINGTPYAFDHVFNTSATQLEVFHIMVEPLIEKLLQGFNSSVLAHGQSGAGKTFTMGLSEKSRGMISLSIDNIFMKLTPEHLAEQFEVSVSFIEIYNEKVYDLLSENSQESIYSKGTKFNGSTKIPVINSDEAEKILQLGNKNRHVRATKLNVTSSRSHAMFSIFVTIKPEPISNEAKTSSVMVICDLAGSEGLRNTNHTGIAQKESVNINQGLLSVGKVVQALSSGKKLIPYRDSVLTTVLQDSLNINSYLTILGCISPAEKDKNETMSTIRFAQSVKTLDSKSVPEFNSYLSEKRILQAQTPMKQYMQSLSRFDQNKTPGNKKTPKYLSTTIKKQPVGTANRYRSFNTPGNLSKIQPSLPRNRLMSTSTVNDMSFMHQTVGSIDNNTFSILNASSSTQVDGVVGTNQSKALPAPATFTFSPLMRQIEKTIDQKFTTIMETLKDERKLMDTVDTTQYHENLKNTVNGEKMIENDETMAVNDETVAYNVNFGIADSTFDIIEEPLISSTIFKKPAEKRSFNQKPNETQLSKTLMRSKLEKTSIEGKEQNRRSKRLLTYDEDGEEAKNRRLTAVVNISPVHDSLIAKCRRRSVRISMYQLNRQMRRSSTPKQIIAKKKKRKNSVVSKFVDRLAQNISKPEIKKAIIEVINKGSLNELKSLPAIGPKTAMQIISRRAVNGDFETLADIKKLPAMKGKLWERFLEGNMLK